MKKILNNLFLFALLFMCFSLVITSCDNTTGQDTVAPEFKGAVNGMLPEISIKVKNNDFETILKQNIEVTDNVDKELTINIIYGNFDSKKIGSYEIAYSVTDNAGNTTTVKRTVHVIDDVAPYFQNTVPGVSEQMLPEMSFLQYSENVELLDDICKVVIDNYDAPSDLVVTVSELNGFNTEKEGTYKVTYKVTDKQGNFSTAVRNIVVKPAVKWIEDVISINGMSHPVLFNNSLAFEKDVNQGANMRGQDQIQLMTKEFYLEQIERLKDVWSNNGGVPFLPYCVLVVLDEDFKPVLVRNATYALEAIKENGEWKLLKNGTMQYPDGTSEVVSTTFKDGAAPSADGVGICGGNLTSYIPDGGYVMIGSASKGGTQDLGKILIIKNLLNSDFGGGALTWDPMETYALGLLKDAQFSYQKDVTTLYEKPLNMPAPKITIEKHVLTFETIEGASKYELYVNGELKVTLTKNTLKMIDLGLEPTLEGADPYQITIKAISSDIRFYGDSEISEVTLYVMPNATTLVAPEVTINESVVSWGEATGAIKYEVYASNGVTSLLIGETSDTSFDLSKVDALKSFVYNCLITVKAIGDGAETLDSELSNGVSFMCSVPKVISFGDGYSYPLIETTVSDYFARRNDGSIVGYSTSNYLYLITDPHNINLDNATNNEAFSFIVLFDKDGKVKSMINILTNEQFLNYVWVDKENTNYTTNSKQIAPLVQAGIVEGDVLLIGKNGCNILETQFGKMGARDLVSHYFWGHFTEETLTKNQPWRGTHQITEFPTYTVKALNPNQLDAPSLVIDGTKISWNEVSKATSYEIFVNNVSVSVQNECLIDIMNYVKEIGRSGNYGYNYSDVTLKVVAKADGKIDGEVIQELTISANLTDGKTQVGVNYNLGSALFNGGSGANFRANDKVAVAFLGKNYKEAKETYKGGYANNNSVPFVQHCVVVVMDKDMKVKAVRYAYVVTTEIESDGTYKTTELTWANNSINAEGGGVLKNLDQEIEDTDYVVIFQNAGTKTVVGAGISMFVDSRSADIVNKSYTPNQDSETKIDYSKTNYSFVFTVTLK